MVLSLGNIAAAVAVVEEEVAKLLTEVSLSWATNNIFAAPKAFGACLGMEIFKGQLV